MRMKLGRLVVLLVGFGMFAGGVLRAQAVDAIDAGLRGRIDRIAAQVTGAARGAFGFGGGGEGRQAGLYACVWEGASGSG